MKEKFNEKVIPIILKFINTKGIQSIKNGMVTSMSPLIIGSIFLILSNFPVKAVVDVLESTGIKAVLDQACGATFSISAMIAVIGISYSYAKLENQEPLNCAIISLASFLILMPSSITTESGEVVMYMFFFAKSKQLKALGKLGIIPALFGINEPILFGAPVVMNPMLAIPFIGMPVIACLIQYFALYTGICPLYGATQIPWTCPPIISGFLLAGWKSALLQLVILCVSFFVYLPFIKKIDKMNLVQEKNQPVEDEDEDW